MATKGAHKASYKLLNPTTHHIKKRLKNPAPKPTKDEASPSADVSPGKSNTGIKRKKNASELADLSEHEVYGQELKKSNKTEEQSAPPVTERSKKEKKEKIAPQKSSRSLEAALKSSGAVDSEPQITEKTLVGSSSKLTKTKRKIVAKEEANNMLERKTKALKVTSETLSQAKRTDVSTKSKVLFSKSGLSNAPVRTGKQRTSKVSTAKSSNQPRSAKTSGRTIKASPLSKEALSDSDNGVSDDEEGGEDEDDKEKEDVDSEDEEDGHLHGFSSNEEDSSDDDDDPTPDEFDTTKLPTIAKDDAVVKLKLDKAKKHPTDDRGVLYLGRLPHGFYEDQLKSYFSQLGEVTRLRVSRNKKTGHSKHYGFIEFDSSSVAQIVADTMDNYLLMGHILVCKVIPKDKVPPELWVGANRKWRKIPRDRISRIQHNQVRTEEQKENAERRLIKRQNAKKRKLQEAGIDYDFDAIAYKKKAKLVEE